MYHSQLLPVTHIEAAIIICALDNYQAEGEIVLHAMSVGDGANDVEILTGTIAAVERTKYLREKLLNLFGK